MGQLLRFVFPLSLKLVVHLLEPPHAALSCVTWDQGFLRFAVFSHGGRVRLCYFRWRTGSMSEWLFLHIGGKRLLARRSGFDGEGRLHRQVLDIAVFVVFEAIC